MIKDNSKIININNQKTAEAVLEVSNLAQNLGLPSYSNCNKSRDIVKPSLIDKQKAVEVRGFEPPDFWMVIPNLRQATPTASLLYQNNSQKSTWIISLKQKLEKTQTLCQARTS